MINNDNDGYECNRVNQRPTAYKGRNDQEAKREIPHNKDKVFVYTTTLEDKYGIRMGKLSSQAPIPHPPSYHTLASIGNKFRNIYGFAVSTSEEISIEKYTKLMDIQTKNLLDVVRAGGSVVLPPDSDILHYKYKSNQLNDEQKIALKSWIQKLKGAGTVPVDKDAFKEPAEWTKVLTNKLELEKGAYRKGGLDALIKAKELDKSSPNLMKKAPEKQKSPKEVSQKYEVKRSSKAVQPLPDRIVNASDVALDEEYFSSPLIPTMVEEDEQQQFIAASKYPLEEQPRALQPLSQGKISVPLGYIHIPEQEKVQKMMRSLSTYDYGYVKKKLKSAETTTTGSDIREVSHGGAIPKHSFQSQRSEDQDKPDSSKLKKKEAAKAIDVLTKKEGSSTQFRAAVGNVVASSSIMQAYHTGLFANPKKEKDESNNKASEKKPEKRFGR